MSPFARRDFAKERQPKWIEGLQVAGCVAGILAMLCMVMYFCHVLQFILE